MWSRSSNLAERFPDKAIIPANDTKFIGMHDARAAKDPKGIFDYKIAYEIAKEAILRKFEKSELENNWIL